MKQKIGSAVLLAFFFTISTAMADTCSIRLNRDLSFTLPHAVYDGNGSQGRSFFHIAFQYSGEHNGFQTWQPVNIGTADPSSSCNTPIYSDLSFAIPDAVYHAGDPVESISMYLGFEYAGGQRWRLVDFSTNHDSPERPSMGQTHANSLGMLFLRIPAGTFMMGSPPEEPEIGRAHV